MKKYTLLFLFFLSLTMSFGGVESVSAEITHPYTVDEKPQVLFGDSVPVSTYYGLENYTQDFVNGYVHITFTYTHGARYVASYPPRLYTTNVDPMTTSTPTVKSLVVIYKLLPSSFNPEHSTDWYLYDIQFDATGYTVVVKKAGTTEIENTYREIPGLVSSDWVSIANYYPMFNPPVRFSMAFTPVPIRDTVLPPTPSRTPVIIVPGIMGSELVDVNSIVNNVIWPNPTKIALSISDDFLDILRMNVIGLPLNDSIVIKDIVREINQTNYFAGLISKLKQDGYIEGIDLFVFPYDWRYEINNSTSDLAEKIDQIKTEVDVQKINIIAHSMGGLIVKEYLRNYGGDSVNNFIDVGTPQVGAPSAFKTLMYGEDLGIRYLFGLFNLNQERIKIITQNMPSVYELLPSSLYGNYLYDLDDFDDNGVRGSLSYTDTKEFMKNTGRNSALIERAGAFHQEIDNLNPADYGVKTYNIVGCGTETLGKIFVMNKETSGGTEYIISYVNGDGTVPLKSAEAIPAYKTYYLKNATHALMPSTSGVKELIVNILTATSTEDFDISPYSNLATTATGCNIPNGKIVSFHSPIDLHIYDSGNNHAGPNANGDIENNIPGVSYEIIDDNKFAFLPDGVEYIIKGSATDAGTFNARIRTVQNENVVETRYFNEVPLLTTTQITFIVGQEISNFISIDNNGDDIFESQIQATSILNALQSQDVTKPVTTLDIKGNKLSDGFYISAVQIRLSAIDDNSGILKTQYSLNGGLTWNTYKKQFVINTRGGVELMYRSTDRAGNIEPIKIANINIIYPGNSGNKR